MVNNHISQTERKNLLDVFKALDTDGDGTLSKNEIIRGELVH
jgi:Ca2+-binding EF-hand superfamily protein